MDVVVIAMILFFGIVLFVIGAYLYDTAPDRRVRVAEADRKVLLAKADCDTIEGVWTHNTELRETVKKLHARNAALLIANGRLHKEMEEARSGPDNG